MDPWQRRVRLGCDIGGTNTDCVVIPLGEAAQAVGWAKIPTTDDTLTGVEEALRAALIDAGRQPCEAR